MVEALWSNILLPNGRPLGVRSRLGKAIEDEIEDDEILASLNGAIFYDPATISELGTRFNGKTDRFRGTKDNAVYKVSWPGK